MGLKQYESLLALYSVGLSEKKAENQKETEKNSKIPLVVEKLLHIQQL